MHDPRAVIALVKQAVLPSVSLSLHWELQHLDSALGHNLAVPTGFKEGIPMEMVGQTKHEGPSTDHMRVPSLFWSAKHFLQNSCR